MNGSLIIDKPEGITSHTVVSRIRRAADTRRVGHAGTLDPFATGVLIVCIGRATRLVQFLVGMDKEYLATVRVGYATDTQDFTGKQITALKSSNDLSAEDLRRVLGRFQGKQLQTPPMFSAKKVGGERLYRAAREGREVGREAVPVVVHSIGLVEAGAGVLVERDDGTREFLMRVHSSSGTYIRTLAHDIGERLGTGAHLSALRRMAVGQFKLADAVTLDEAEGLGRAGRLGEAVVTMSDTVGHLPGFAIGAEAVGRVVNGREIDVFDRGRAVDSGGWVRLCDESGELVALGEYSAEGGKVRPRVVVWG